MEELYVYYKVAAAQTEAARDAFERLRAVLSMQWPGLHSRLLMRPAAAGAVQTWMEIHRWPDGGIDAPSDWIDEIERRAGHLAGSSLGERHVEVFVPLSRCAAQAAIQGDFTVP